MLNILVTAANNEEGRRELREFEEFLNRVFVIRHKSRTRGMKICYYKGKSAHINRTDFNRFLNNSDLLEDPSNAVSVIIRDPVYAQQQSTLIHQANPYQGVNLIYAVDTKPVDNRY
ncbi:MAG: hypothetical protein RSA29_15770 [Clostridium sp.]|uniref:RebB family R body protein n=1 Tax=Clostridium sp. TaxID=1506 RepID=UPI00304CA959